MKRSIALVVALSVVLSTTLTSCTTAEQDSIVVATNASFPPMGFVEESKEIVGSDIDLMYAIAEVQGLTVEVPERGLGRHLCRSGERRL